MIFDSNSVGGVEARRRRRRSANESSSRWPVFSALFVLFIVLRRDLLHLSFLSLSLLSVCVYICDSKWRIDAFANSLENFFTRASALFVSTTHNNTFTLRSERAVEKKDGSLRRSASPGVLDETKKRRGRRRRRRRDEECQRYY